jgi:hypothetical protein
VAKNSRGIVVETAARTQQTHVAFCYFDVLPVEDELVPLPEELGVEVPLDGEEDGVEGVAELPASFLAACL